MQKNDPLEAVLEVIIKGIGRFLAGAGWGMRQLSGRTPALCVWLLCTVAAALGAWFFRAKLLQVPLPHIALNYGLLAAMFLSPLIYLNVIGRQIKANADHYRDAFLAIGFIGKDKKPPVLLHLEEGEKQLLMRFKSTIPLEKWRSKIKDIETALDVTITRIDPGKSKRVVEIGAISSEYQIPEDVHWSDEYIHEKGSVIVLGESALGPIEVDLNKHPHLLLAGETGSGKSVLLREILWQLIKKQARVFMVDFKGGVEFGIQYEQYGPVVTEHKDALKMFDMLVKENKERLDLFRQTQVKNLDEYNRKTGSNLCRMGVFIDEVAEMTDRTGCNQQTKQLLEQIEGRVSSLARLARVTGINLVLGTQRPDAKVVTGQIKTNVPVRISGRFADNAASQIVLGNTMATTLPNIKGRFLYKCGPDTVQFQAYYFDDDTMLKPISVEPGDLLIEIGQNHTEYRPHKEIASSIIMDSDEPVELDDYVAPTKEVLDLEFDFED